MKIVKLLFLSCFAICLFAINPAMAEEFSDSTANDDAAKDNTQVYQLTDDISLTSTIKFQYGSKPKLFVKSVFPVISNDLEEDNLQSFNDSINTMIKQIVAEFKYQAVQNMSAATNLPHLSNKNDLYIDYDSSFVSSGEENPILSVRFTIQGFLAGMAHPYHIHRVLNFDLATGQKIELASLFVPDSNYLNVLSKYTNKRLAKRFSNKELVAMGTGPAAENFSNWNIKSNGILFTFDENQVASYVHGAQTVLVPYVAIRNIISPDAPIAGCVAHTKKCSQTSMLTGGFIDEAVNTHHRGLNPVLSKL